MNVILLSIKNGWTWVEWGVSPMEWEWRNLCGMRWTWVLSLVEWGGINECKSNEEGPNERIEWNKIDLGVIIVYNWDILECINVKNSCTPFHMKIFNSQNSFGGWIIL
jgi:hypothetical protein